MSTQYFRSTLLICTLVLFSCKSNIKEKLQVFELKPGEFLIDVVETGELKATQSINIAAPSINWRFGELKITKLINDGSAVKQGDTLILFDQAEVQKAIIDAQAELDIAHAELEKLQATQQSKIEDLEADLKMTEISYQISKLELEQATYEAEIRKKEIQLQLNQAEISLNKARDEIENHKKIHREELHQKELNIKQLDDNLKDAYDTVAKLTVTAENPGIAIIEDNWMSGNKWQVGDQPYMGWPMISLPDLSEIKSVTDINEVDISKIKLNQTVRVKLDAYPDTTFAGKVISIANLAKEKSKESKAKVFPLEILIDGYHKLLMPGMTVSCQIIVNKIDSVLFVPIDALHKKEGKNTVHLVKGNSFEDREVAVGAYNNDYAVIEDGLKKGDRVALGDPGRLAEDAKKKKR
jgi:HlyD family secretion protein